MSKQDRNGKSGRQSPGPVGDDVYRAALAALRLDLAAVESDVATARAVCAAAEGRHAELCRAEAVLAALAGEDPPARTSHADRRTTAESIERVLLEAGRPLPPHDIIRTMVVAGHPMPADPKSRYSFVYSALRRHFVQTGDRRWTLPGGIGAESGRS